MKDKIKALAVNPYAYIAGFSMGGAGSIVAGIAIMAGLGWALIASGAFSIAAASYITKGLKPNV